MTPYEPVGWGLRPSWFSRWWPAFAVVIGLVLIAYIGFGARAGCPGATGAAAEAPCPTPEAASPVVGIVVAVDSAGLSNVKGFTLRDPASGFAFVFTLGPLENPTEFSPGHLAEHLATSEPIRVFFRNESGELVAYRIEDASEETSPSP